jgi:hypothetical protein
VSLTPSDRSVKGTWLWENAAPFVARNLWKFYTALAFFAGLVVGWAVFGPVTPN